MNASPVNPIAINSFVFMFDNAVLSDVYSGDGFLG